MPQKSALLVQIRLPQTADTEVLLTASGLDFGYDRQWYQYRLRLGNEDINKNTALLRNLMGKHETRTLSERDS